MECDLVSLKWLARQLVPWAHFLLHERGFLLRGWGRGLGEHSLVGEEGLRPFKADDAGIIGVSIRRDQTDLEVPKRKQVVDLLNQATWAV